MSESQDHEPVTAPPARSEHAVTVLLVDDQQIIGEAIRRALVGESDMHFHFCSKSAEAIGVAEEIKPTVILQDLVMPGVDGLTLVRQYRASPITKDIPILVLSTKEEPAIKSEAFTAGANDYLVKLPDKIELIARIRYHSKAYLNQLRRENPLAVYNPGWDAKRLWLLKYIEIARGVRLEGLARDGEDVSELARRMALSSYFADVKLMPAKKTRSAEAGMDLVQFQLEAKARY